MPDGVRVYMFYSYTGDGMDIKEHTHTLIDTYMCIPTDTHPNSYTHKRHTHTYMYTHRYHKHM